MSGIERQIDKLGRVVLPISFRRRLALTENSKVRISLDDNAIIITPSKNVVHCAVQIQTRIGIYNYVTSVLKK